MTAIVTLTKYADIFYRLKASVNEWEPVTLPRIVVTNHPDVNTFGWNRIDGIEPFCFARNANLALRRCLEARQDVLLINDDCELLHSIVPTLEYTCQQNPNIGILSPQIDGGVGNRLQHRIDVCDPYKVSQERLAFVCVFIPSSTMERVGLLDERFTGYGGDDVDYCRRVQAAGLGLAITSRVVVRHGYGHNGMSTSFLRALTLEERNRQMRDMNRVLEEKWNSVGDCTSTR